ncbi:DUF3501 family protein [Azospirillum sp.]|uniref:DUF3501 family protein n=1 Tax=Azospirillum sp. TaxID=34012 RepID=UPI003D73D69D
MTALKTEITRADIIPPAEYAKERAARRKALVEVKKHRRVSVGPYATFYFENYDTMWQQIHEMLHIEKGGEEQIADELRAYNPLIPKGRELVATVMFEIDNPVQRQTFLTRLGGVEETMQLQFAGHTVQARPEADVERTNEEGKASSVHFMHFDFTDAQVAAFRTPGTQVVVAFTHPNYGHMAVMPERVREELAKDFA